MAATIYSLVKIFTDKSHAEKFRNGQLHMKTLRMFKEYKDESGILRGDPMEGIVAWYQPDKVDIKINGYKIPAHDFAGPIVLHSSELLDKNAFCMYAVNSRGHDRITPETIEDFKRALQIHENCFGLGSYCVAVLDFREFNNRCRSAIESLGIWGKAALVDYFDEKTFHGDLPTEMLGFQKRSIFAQQREYRLLLDLKREPGIFELNLGDLSDITSPVITPNDFNRGLEIKVSGTDTSVEKAV